MKIKPFLKSLFTARTPLTEVTTPITEQQLEDTIAELHEHLRLARSAHLAAARRISTFGQEQPELYRLYFTRAGEKVRKGQLHDAA